MKRRNLLIGGGALATVVACSPNQANTVDHIVVDKSAREMTLYRGASAVKRYNINLGSNPIGHKLYEGDGRTPEGRYRIVSKNPRSQYHLSLEISYPDRDDVANAEANGWNPGGDIFIHGGPTLARDRNRRDWTAGCIAVSDREIEQIYRLTKIGAIIDIRA